MTLQMQWAVSIQMDTAHHHDVCVQKIYKCLILLQHTQPNTRPYPHTHKCIYTDGHSSSPRAFWRTTIWYCFYTHTQTHTCTLACLHITIQMDTVDYHAYVEREAHDITSPAPEHNAENLRNCWYTCPHTNTHTGTHTHTRTHAHTHTHTRTFMRVGTSVLTPCWNHWRVLVPIHVNERTNARTRTQTHANTHTHTRKHKRTRTHAHTHTHTYPLTHKRTLTHAHIYIHTHTHTHIRARYQGFDSSIFNTLNPAGNHQQDFYAHIYVCRHT